MVLLKRLVSVHLQIGYRKFLVSDNNLLLVGLGVSCLL